MNGRWQEVVNANETPTAPDTPPLPPPHVAGAVSKCRCHAHTQTDHAARPATRRALGASRRSADRGHRGCPHPGYVLVCPAAPPRCPPAHTRGTRLLGRLANAAGALRAARPHRAVAHGAALAPRRGAGALAQHGQLPAAPTRRTAAHLPKRLRGASLARQGQADLCAHGAGLQRAASAAGRAPRRCGCGDTRLVRPRQDRPRAPAPATRRRLRTAADRSAHGEEPALRERRSPRAPA